MYLFTEKRRRQPEKVTRQQKRKLQRDLVKLTRKVRRRAELTLNDERIPGWIRAVKRSQLEASGLLQKKNEHENTTGMSATKNSTKTDNKGGKKGNGGTMNVNERPARPPKKKK